MMILSVTKIKLQLMFWMMKLKIKVTQNGTVRFRIIHVHTAPIAIVRVQILIGLDFFMISVRQAIKFYVGILIVANMSEIKNYKRYDL